MSSSHENDPILPLLLVRDVPDSRIFGTMRESGHCLLKLVLIEWSHSHVQITKNSMCCPGAKGDSPINVRPALGLESPRHRLLLRLVLASHLYGNHLQRVLATQYTIVLSSTYHDRPGLESGMLNSDARTTHYL